MKKPTDTPVMDKARAAELRERLRGLPPQVANTVRDVMRLHAAGDLLMAGQWLLQAAAEAPDHPEVLLWQGVLALDAKDWPAAAAHLAGAVAQRPQDNRLWRMLAHAQDQAGDGVSALHSLRQASATARDAADWLSLSLECDRQGRYDESLAAVQSVLALQPRSPVALLQRARCHKALGDAQAAAADCRSLIAADQEAARAWFTLVDLKTVRLTEGEVRQLQQAAARPGVPAVERQLLGFALGKALEDAGQHATALAAFADANASVRAGLPWDASAFDRHVQAVRDAFIAPGPAASPADVAGMGGEMIFIVGLPRSGSTLVEQVLASHPSVEGASELPYLPQLIQAESRRRGRPFPLWVPQASADDWARLGRHYLHLTARWRQHKPFATDKLPDNWLYVGALRAMLPQARVVDCRRDALQTCWSCFKQLFGPGLAGYSYDFHSLAAYARACEGLGDHFAALHPAHVRVQRYEALVADPEGQTRALLDACGLPFDAACLSPHTAQRAIRTPSALQVRQPMRQTSVPADGYGDLLAPLRDALAAVGPR